MFDMWASTRENLSFEFLPKYDSNVFLSCSDKKQKKTNKKTNRKKTDNKKHVKFPSIQIVNIKS